MSKKSAIIFVISILLVLGIAGSIQAQSFVVIGSEQAPIRYIKGTGSNIGLTAGVEYLPNGSVSQKILRPLGEIVVGRYFRRSSIKGAGQGMCKPLLTPLRMNLSGHNILRTNDSQENMLTRMMAKRTAYLSHATDNTSDDSFQIKPVYDYELESGVITEIPLPVLCLDQVLNPPEPKLDRDFVISDLPDDVAQMFIGIYRFDKYMNESITPKIWYKDGGFTWYEGTLTEAEVSMVLFCEVETDPSTLSKEPIGYHDVTSAYLAPSHAQWPIWAANGDQNKETFLEGYNHILRESYNEPPVALEDITDFLHLNHIVFHLANMMDFKERFPKPDGAELLPAANLDPYAFIQTSPKLFETQNNEDGIVFSAQHSFDPDGKIDYYEWTYDRGRIEKKPTIQIQFGGYSTKLTPVVLRVVDNDGGIATDTVYVPYSPRTNVEDELNIPSEFELRQNYPNPFNNRTTIPFSLMERGLVKIQILNTLGEEVRLLACKHFPSGMHNISWNGKDNHQNDVPSGVYLYRLQTGNHLSTRKLLRIK